MKIAIVIGVIVIGTLGFYTLKFLWFVVKMLFHWDAKEVQDKIVIPEENGNQEND